MKTGLTHRIASLRRRRLLVAGAVLPLVGACRSTPFDTPERGPFAAAFSARIDDQGPAQAIFEGLQRVRDALGIELRHVDGLDRRDARTDAAALMSLRALAESDATMIIVHGAALTPLTHRVAWEYPRQRFTLVQGIAKRPNVAAYLAMHEHASFLAGVAAARLTRSGIVGHIAADDDSSATRAAFAYGLATGNPKSRLLTSIRANQGDATLAERIASAQIEAGADVLYVALVREREAVVRTAKRKNIQLIGDGRDWVTAQSDTFIAAAVTDLTALVTLIGRDINDAVWRGDFTRRFGIRQPELVRLVLSSAAPAPVQAAIDDARNQLAAGRIKIPAVYTGPEFELPA